VVVEKTVRKTERFFDNRYKSFEHSNFEFVSDFGFKKSPIFILGINF